MDRIFDDAKDKYVRATYVYGKASDTAAYVDSECTEKYKTSALKEVFLKGAVIVIGSDLFAPLNFILKSGVGSITYVKADTTTATTAVLGTLSSAKD